MIVSVTPPQEVQKAIDDKSRLGVFDDLNKLLQLKAAMAVEKVAEQQGAAGAGAGMGLGLMMPAMFANAFAGGGRACRRPTPCPSAATRLRRARFARVAADSSWSSRSASAARKTSPRGSLLRPLRHTLGRKAPGEEMREVRLENLPESVFCNQCGEKLE